MPALSASEPADIGMANHVLYLWKDPAPEMAQIRGSCNRGGVLALDYQPKQHMPDGATTLSTRRTQALRVGDAELTRLAIAEGSGSVTTSSRARPKRQRAGRC